MNLLNKLRELSRPGWRTEALGMTAITGYFIIIFYNEGGVLDAPLFIQLNLILLIGLATYVTGTMIRLFRKGKKSANRDYFMSSALLATLIGGYFALNDAVVNSIPGYSPKEAINFLGDLYMYGYFSFALYSFYRAGGR
ncbi:hypothetical protein ACMFFG_30220 (plasmid) [Citrobacter freundii]|uniref:hypothetical protein n=1 Tax=Citrobacter freundii TaxID=546 RepID=UPI003CE98213